MLISPSKEVPTALGFNCNLTCRENGSRARSWFSGEAEESGSSPFATVLEAWFSVVSGSVLL